jgi:fructokinase
LGVAVTIVGIGEALFDIFPEGARKLGGAPLNFAVHANQLARGFGGRGMAVSRVGTDDLGDDVIAALSATGMDTRYIQRDPAHPTGQVLVGLSATGQPEYSIETGAAWDFLRFEDGLTELAENCDAVCFGSLAQRSPQSRESIRLFLELAKDAIRLFDVNLRQNWYDFSALIDSCNLATAIKLNIDELDKLVDLFGLPRDEGVQSFFHHFPIDYLVLTRGEQGTAIYTQAGSVEGEPVSYPMTAYADAVGAGDACAAATVVGLLARMPLAEIANAANHVGAFVAASTGATPGLPERIVRMFGSGAA